jgi:hypothetical protein
MWSFYVSHPEGKSVDHEWKVKIFLSRHWSYLLTRTIFPNLFLSNSLEAFV